MIKWDFLGGDTSVYHNGLMIKQEKTPDRGGDDFEELIFKNV